MKFFIIIGFFSTIFTVSAIPQEYNKKDCVILSRKTYDITRKCMKDIPEDTLNNFMSYSKATATREIKCLALCFFNGKMIDGKFDPVIVENDVREFTGPADRINKLADIDLAAANTANAEEGDECDRAYAFHAASGALRIQSNLEIIFC